MWSDLGICLNYIELDKIEDAKTCVDKLYKDYEMYPEFIAVRKALYNYQILKLNISKPNPRPEPNTDPEPNSIP